MVNEKKKKDRKTIERKSSEFKILKLGKLDDKSLDNARFLTPFTLYKYFRSLETNQSVRKIERERLSNESQRTFVYFPIQHTPGSFNFSPPLPILIRTDGTTVAKSLQCNHFSTTPGYFARRLLKSSTIYQAQNSSLTIRFIHISLEKKSIRVRCTTALYKFKFLSS